MSTFEQYDSLADILIEKASKEQLAECARLLALNLAHHKAKHGEISLDATFALVDMSEPNETQEKLLTVMRIWLNIKRKANGDEAGW